MTLNTGTLLQLSGDDLGPFFIDRFSARPTAASPLRELLLGYKPGTRKLSPGGAEAAELETAKDLARIVANPKLVLITQTGGGPQPMVRTVIVHNPACDEQAFVGVTASFEGAVLFEGHESPWFFLARWLDRVAGGADEDVPNLLPPPTTPIEMLLMLHAADLFRRTELESQLESANHGPTGAVTPEVFAATWASSIESRDPRWLLPAYLLMMPDAGLEGASLDSPDQLEVLQRRGFLIPASDDEDQDLLVFGEAGRLLGTEFMRLWSGAVGYQAMIARRDGLDPVASGFLATTALTHHLFQLKEDENQQPFVNHQPLTRSALETTMAQLMAHLLELATQPESESQVMAEWHYVSRGEKYGPIPEADLKKYFAEGYLPRDTMVWHPGLETWAPAFEIPDFGLAKPEVTPPAEVETQWFYAVGEHQIGPVSETDLKARLKSAQLPASILVWKVGMSQWLPASSIPGFWV